MDDSNYSNRAPLEPEVKVPEVRFPEASDKLNFYS